MNRTFASIAAGALTAIIIICGQAKAHTSLETIVSKQITLSAGAKYIDVSISATFFAGAASHERAHMDANVDGTIDEREEERYLEEVESWQADNVLLHVNGRGIEMIPRYKPRIDLGGNRNADSGAFVIILESFCRLPSRLETGSEIRLRENVWGDAASTTSFAAKGTDGCRLRAMSRQAARTQGGGKSGNRAANTFIIRIDDAPDGPGADTNVLNAGRVGQP